MATLFVNFGSLRGELLGEEGINSVQWVQWVGVRCGESRDLIRQLKIGGTREGVDHDGEKRLSG